MLGVKQTKGCGDPKGQEAEHGVSWGMGEASESPEQVVLGLL